MLVAVVAMWSLSRTGNELLLGVTVGGFLLALVFNLIPTTTALRATVLAAGVVAAIAVIATRPYGEDRGIWAVISGLGLLAWFLGFAIAGVVRSLEEAAPRASAEVQGSASRVSYLIKSSQDVAGDDPRFLRLRRWTR